MKKQILFVDDDCNVLEGLRRMLRPLRDEWDMQFVMSGPEALEILDAGPIDLIITDMRMPEMDGSELLAEVTKRHPDVIRMVLSGQADSKLIMKAIGIAHQFISKPCNPECLKSTIQQAINLRTLMKNSDLKNIISEMDTLPSVPSLYMEVLKELQSMDSSVHKVGQIVAQDPGMTAKILQLANSAFFGCRRHLSNTADAVAYLGLDHVRHLTLAVHAFSQFAPGKISSFSIERLWEHSISTAALAKKIAEEEEAGRDIADDAFTAGLLHDIGKLMLACRLADKHEAAVDLARMKAMPLWLAEQQVFSTTHAEVGAYLLGLWGLPDAIVEATAYHHRPMDSKNNNFNALTALHVADCLNEHQTFQGIAAPQPDMNYLSRFHLKCNVAVLCES
jgi:putative nucleotidyltransferase with HDIG domain